MSFASNRYKDKEKYAIAKREQKRRYRANSGAYKFVKRPWDLKDIITVLKHEKPDRELSEELCRSISAIQECRRINKNKGYI